MKDDCNGVFARVGGWLLVCTMLMVSGPARAQALFEEVASTGDLTSVGILERPLAIAVAGSHDVSLRDLGVPATLTQVRAAITRGTTVVGALEVSAGQPAPATLRVNLEAGSYMVRVIGTPNTAARAGSVAVGITRVSDAASVLQFNDAIALAAPAVPDNTRIFEASFLAADNSTHTLALADLAFPGVAQSLNLIVTRGSVVVGTPLATAGSFTFQGQPRGAGETAESATYTVRVIATAATASAGALLNVRVRSATGVTALDQSIAVGQVRGAGQQDLQAGGHTLRITDLAFPAALATRQAVAVAGGLVVARAAAASDATFTAVAGPHEIFVMARPATEPGSGGYAVELLQGSAAVFTHAAAVNVGAVAAPAFAYSTSLTTAGNYQLRLSDFQFPNTFTSMRAVASQGGAAVGTLASAGSVELAGLRAGRIFVLVLGQPGGTTGGGVLGVELAPAAGGSAVFEVTQGIGALFAARRVTVTTAGRYDATVRDLAFPAGFIELFAIVTRGPTRVGSIFGGGSFSFDATPGSYFVNFIARADLAQKAGTYGIAVVPTPPAPTVTLSSASQSVTTGGTTSLTWSSTNASACTASGGWTGSRSTAGTETSPAISASTTFTLTCTGAGGSAAQSVTVNVAPAPASGGGGGSLDALTLAALLLVFGWRRSMRAGGSRRVYCASM